MPVHSVMSGGALADSAIAMNVLLSRLYLEDGPLTVPGIYDRVRTLTDPERRTIQSLPGEEAKMREDLGILPGVRLATEKGCHVYEQTWLFFFSSRRRHTRLTCDWSSDVCSSD